MELAQLVFDVNTEKLKLAKDAVDALAKSMSDLNTAQGREAKGASSSAAATEGSTNAVNENTEATKKNVSVLERQKMILEYQAQGFSKSQSTTLASAKATGALTAELKELEGVVKTSRKLMGGSPFDASMSGLVSIRNQIGEVREAMRQYNAESGLTSKQTRELARDKERLLERMKLIPHTLTDVKNALRTLNAEYVKEASVLNTMLKVEKDAERAARDHANAIRNVAAAEERLFATVSHINDGMSQNASLNERAALAVGSYERNLRLAGITGEAAAAKLMKFRAAQAQITASENQRMGDYIARGIGVQVGDIGVSLASGQNPLIVMIQQLDQVRGLIQQAGHDGLDLKNVMNDSVRQIARSFKEVGVAVGSFIGGAFKTLGDSLYNLTNRFFDVQKAALDFGIVLESLGMSSESALSAATNSLGILRGVFTVFAAAAVASIASLGIAWYQSVKASDELAKQFALTGNAMGVNSANVGDLRNNLRELNITGSVTNDVLMSMSKAGGFASSEIQMVAKAANDMSKYAGIAIEDTVAAYAKMKKDPVDALIEVAKSTGMVTAATIESIRQLKEQGDTTLASSAAMKELARVHSEQVEAMKATYSGFKLFIIGLWDSLAQFWDKVFAKTFDNATASKSLDELKVKYNGLLNIGDPNGEASDVKKKIEALEKVLNVNTNITAEQKKQIDLNNEAAKLRESGVSKEQKYMNERAELLRKINEVVDPANKLVFQEKLNTLTKEYNESLKSRSKGESEATKVDKAYASALERISKLGIQVNKVNADGALSIEQTTKAYGLLLDLKDDPLWGKFEEGERNSIKTKLEAIGAIEVQTLRLNEQKKSLEALSKLYEKIDVDNAKGTSEVEATTKELEFQYSILGKSEKEVRALTAAYEERKEIAKIITEQEALQYQYLREYVKATEGLTDDTQLNQKAFELTAKLEQSRLISEDRIAQARDKNTLKSAQYFDREWSRVQDSLSNILYDSLFNGGKNAAKSIRKLIEDELKREFVIPAIKVLVNYVTNAGGQLIGAVGNAAINGILGTSDSNGGSGTNYLGTASNLSSAYNMASGSSMSTLGAAVSYLGNATGSLSMSAYGTGMGLTSAQAASASAAYSVAAAEASASAASSLAMAAEAGAAGNLVAAEALTAKAAASEAAAASYTATGTGISSGSGAATAVGWIAAIVMGMYMSGEAWQNGIRWENYAKDDDAKKYDAEVGIRKLHDDPARAIFGDKFVDSKFYAVAGGGSLSAMIHGAVQKGLWGGDWGPDGSDSRLSGTFSEANRFTGGQISQDFVKDGGWFHSDKRETRRQDISSELDNIMDGIYIAIRNSLVMTGELFQDFSLADKIKDFSLAIDGLSGSNLDESIVAASDQLAEAMGKVLFPSIDALRVNVVDQAKGLQSQLEQAKRTGDVALASNLDAQIKNLQGLDNETWLSAFGRILQAAQGVTRIFDLMGKSMVDVFGEGNANKVLLLSASLTEMFGGIDKLSSSFSAYYGNFYSAEEQRVQVVNDLTKSFSSMNLELPSTREEFRKIVDGLDLTTVSGQNTFKSLMDLQGTFASLTPAIESSTEAVRESVTKRKELEAQIFALTHTALEVTAKQREEELATLSESLKPLQLRVYALQDEAEAAKLAAENAERIAASMRNLSGESENLKITLMRLKGNTTGADAAQYKIDTRGFSAGEIAIYDYNLALKSQISALEAAQAAALQAAQAAQALASKIENERNSLIRQLYSVQGNVAALRQLDLDALDPSNHAMQLHIWSLEDAAKASTNAANAASTLRSAWESLTNSLFDEVRRIRGLIVEESPVGYAQAQTNFSLATIQARAGNKDAAEQLPELSRILLELAETNVSTLVELQRVRATTAGSLQTTGGIVGRRGGVSVPSFDVGTNYVPSDMLAQIHEGEAIIPKAFNPAAGGNEEVIAELRKLNDRLVAIEWQADKTRTSSALTARVLDDAAKGKNPITTEAI